VLHVFLAVNIVAFSLGIVVLILGTLSFRRSGTAIFRDFTLLAAAGVVYLLLDMIRLYSRAAAGVISGALPYVAMTLSGAANGMAGFAIPALAFQVVAIRISRTRAIIHAAVVVVMVVLGILDDLSSDLAFSFVDTAALACLQGYGAVVLLAGFRRIEHEAVRGLARSFMVVMLCGVPLMLAERVAASLPGTPSFLREYNLAELAYFLGLSVLVIKYALRYLFEATPAAPAVLPERFIEKYGISPREREIISMMLRGYGNRKISETLFISAMTVKNHIYHIYQKTGVANKIQLINIINSPK